MSSFLYPFLDAESTPAIDVHELAALGMRAFAESDRVEAATVTQNGERITAAATLIEETLRGGGTIHTFGNGGSACDAERFARLLLVAVGDGARVGVLHDGAVLSAIANDVGAVNVFARQVDAHVRRGDVVVAFTTSGTSPNVIAGLQAAHSKRAATIAFAGYGGGTLASEPDIDVLLVVDDSSVHRIQEATGALCLAVCTSESLFGRRVSLPPATVTSAARMQT